MQVYKIDDLQQNLDLDESVEREVHILRSIKHPSLLELIGLYKDTYCVYVLFNRYNQMPLSKYFLKKEPFENLQISYVTLQLKGHLQMLKGAEIPRKTWVLPRSTQFEQHFDWPLLKNGRFACFQLRFRWKGCHRRFELVFDEIIQSFFQSWNFKSE